MKIVVLFNDPIITLFTVDGLMTEIVDSIPSCKRADANF